MQLLIIYFSSSQVQALSTIDTCLQTRLDLMSTLFEQVDIAYDHESKIYKELVELRTKQEGIKEENSH